VTQLVVGEAVGADQGLGVQSAGLSGEPEPAVDGTAIDAQDLGDGGRLVSLGDGFDGSPSAVFEFAAGDRRAHATLYAAAA
jgi:hypothetical protein